MKKTLVFFLIIFFTVSIPRTHAKRDPINDSYMPDNAAPNTPVNQAALEFAEAQELKASKNANFVIAKYGASGAYQTLLSNQLAQNQLLISNRELYRQMMITRLRQISSIVLVMVIIVLGFYGVIQRHGNKNTMAANSLPDQ